MKMKRLLFSLIICSFVFTGNANAVWGPSSCSSQNHCYGLVKQEINGTASFADVFNQGNYVASGEFITNELWVGFPGGWIETGEIAGTENCCTRYRFFAQQHPGSPFYLNIDYEAGSIPLNESIVYGIQQCGGPWCITWNHQVIHQFGGWPTHFSEREIGIEIATETKPSAYGAALGIEGDEKMWILPPPIEYEMAPGICESGIEPGLCGFGRFGAYTQINWGFGNGPHDDFGLREQIKVKKHKLHTVPEKKGSHIRGHFTRRRNKEGRVNQIWVGKKPTPQEIVGEY